MIDLFMPFRAFLKFENVCTDNNVFRMHYKITVIILLVFTLLVSSKQFFGEPIHCISNSEKDGDTDAINSYCWIYGTYTVKSRLVGIQGKHYAYPGVGPKIVDDTEYKHLYYQWVCFVLLAQSVMFYTPRYLWKIWEGGRMKALAADLSSPVVTKDWSEFRRGELISYLSYTNVHSHNMYALRYAFCEILNLANVVGQLFILDIYLNGAFRNYGLAAFLHIPRHPDEFIDLASVNPMDKVFPKVTKCWLRNYGPSGGLQLYDRLCILPLNIVNERIFVVVWFWLILLSLISLLTVIFRILVLCLRPLRTVMIAGQLRYVKRSLINRIVKRVGYGDWFVLYLLGKNMNPIIYKDLLVELSKELEQHTIMV